MGKSLSGAIVVSSADGFACRRRMCNCNCMTDACRSSRRTRPCDRFSPNGRGSARPKVVNVERIPGGPLTLELSDMPEAQALDVLLRSVSGYMAAPRGRPSRTFPCSIASSSCRPSPRLDPRPRPRRPHRRSSSRSSRPRRRRRTTTPTTRRPPASRVRRRRARRSSTRSRRRKSVVRGASAFRCRADQARASHRHIGSTPSAAAGGGVVVPGMMTQPPAARQPGAMASRCRHRCSPSRRPCRQLNRARSVSRSVRADVAALSNNSVPRIADLNAAIADAMRRHDAVRLSTSGCSRPAS